MPCSHRWATVGLIPIEMTRDSQSSDRGRLVGGATHRLKVKPALAVKTVREQSQTHRLGGEDGLVRSNQMELLRRARSRRLGVPPWKPGLSLSLCKRTQSYIQCHP